VRRALAWASEADLCLAVFDGTVAEPDRATVEALGWGEGRWIGVASKADLRRSLSSVVGRELLPVSAVTGEGIDVLLDAVAAAIEPGGGEGEAVLTRARHRAGVAEAESALRRAVTMPLAELRAEELRAALRALGRLTGRVDVEDLLDQVFATFCIGK